MLWPERESPGVCVGGAGNQGEHHGDALLGEGTRREGEKAAKVEKEQVRFKDRARAGWDTASHLREDRDWLERDSVFFFFFFLS